jgi:hypothetical protein
MTLDANPAAWIEVVPVISSSSIDRAFVDPQHALRNAIISTKCRFVAIPQVFSGGGGSGRSWAAGNSAPAMVTSRAPYSARFDQVWVVDSMARLG